MEYAGLKTTFGQLLRNNKLNTQNEEEIGIHTLYLCLHLCICPHITCNKSYTDKRKSCKQFNLQL